MPRIIDVFRRAQDEGRIALIGYLPAGFPNRQDFPEIVKTAFQSGLDILEIGLPTTTASLDGRIIRSALKRIAQQGIDAREALRMGAEAVHSARGIGLAMLYAETLAAYGEELFLDDCRKMNIDGALPIGLTFQAWLSFASEARKRNTETIGFVSLDMSDDVLRETLGVAGGFAYVQSYNGPTGRAISFGSDIADRFFHIRSLMAANPLPLAVGFGVRKPKDVARIRTLGADGVIVGTVMVEAAARGAAAVRELVCGLFQATRK